MSGSSESSPTRMMPIKATLWALPVHYRDLWKIRAPVGTTEGFDLQPFDKLIMVSVFFPFHPASSILYAFR